jgi:hypothetical protein
MATLTNNGWTGRPEPTARAPLPPDPSCQPCPDCGGLQCLCRPRFFAGQLLSEADLNRLDHYITEKHKLHNRHLWGSGVVCGLEVRCSPCDDRVTVSDGYALSPCGEDIVVCKPDTVDVCALIARCRTDGEPDCRSYAPQDACGDVIEDWILAIRYAETPSRGVTPLIGAAQSCGCSCSGNCNGRGGCGGSCGGGYGFGCGPAQAVAAVPALTVPRLNRGAPPSCEPTVTCEAYRYDVYRVPEPPTPQRGDNRHGLSGIAGQLEGDMFAQIACCLKSIEAAIPLLPGDLTMIKDGDRQAWFNWCCRVRTALANYLARSGGANCDAAAQLQAIACPLPSLDIENFRVAMIDALKAYFLIVIEAMIGCICSAALPHCPPPGDPRVPLAVIKVRRRDCRIVSVCNWTPYRKHVITFPTLGYWLGWLPIGRLLHEFMHKLCCDLLGLGRLFEPQRAAAAQPAMMATHATVAPVTVMDERIPVSPFAGFRADTTLFEAAAHRGAQDQPGIAVADLLRSVFDRANVGIDPGLGGEARAAEIARLANTAPMAVLGAVAQPVLDHIAQFGRNPAAPAASADLAELRAAVARQAEEIAALRRDMAPPPQTNRKARNR